MPLLLQDVPRHIAMLKALKRLESVSSWAQRKNHVGHYTLNAALSFDDGATAAGYLFEIEIKYPVMIAECLFLFTIFYLQESSRNRERIYQFEVAPKIKRTHIGPPDIYGPHWHAPVVGATKLEVIPVEHPEVSCNNWSACLRTALEFANIAHIEIDDPRHDTLF